MTAREANTTADGGLACASGTPWLDHFGPPTGTGRGCVACGTKGRDEMRFIDQDRVGCYLDAIDHRVEKTKEGGETAMVDLTLRIQPLVPSLAAALSPGVRALLFTLGDGEPHALIKSLTFTLKPPNQHVEVHLLPEDARVALKLHDVEISGLRARTEKGVDGYGLVFYASWGPVGRDELEYVVAWQTQQRFLTFTPSQAVLDFAARPAATDDPPPAPPKRGKRAAAVEPGDELRPGTHAEH